MSKLNEKESALLWSTVAAFVVAALIEIRPEISKPFMESLYNLVVVVGPVVGAGLIIRWNVYSKDTVKKLMEG